MDVPHRHGGDREVAYKFAQPLEREIEIGGDEANDRRR